MSNQKSGIKGGLLWSFGERVSAQLVSMIVTIILARLLDPTHYGMISIVTVFITFCDVFVTSGMGSALVQKREATERDYNTAFYISLTISAVLYVLLFFAAPWIADFYAMPVLAWVLRIMALRLPLTAMNSIQQARVQRAMQFKRFFFATLFGTVLSGVVGITLALWGAGVWALVAQYLANAAVNTGVLFCVDKWIPKFQFSMERAQEIFSFGWKVLLTDLVYTVEEDIRSLIIGKVFGAADLAYYDQGKKYPGILVNNLNAAINKVMLSAYSRSQDNLDNLKRMLRKSIGVGVFVLAPILIGFAAVSDTFISVILTDKWMFCSPYIKVFCIMYLTRPLETSCHQALLAIGRSDIVLYIMILINVVALAAVLIATFAFHSVFLIAIGSLIASLVSLAGFMAYSKRFIGYSFREQMQDITPSLLCSALMGGIVYLIGTLEMHKGVLLFTQVVMGGIVYLLLAMGFKISACQYLLGMLKKFVNKQSG